MSALEPLDEYDDWLSTNSGWLENTYVGEFPTSYQSTTVDSDLTKKACEHSVSLAGEDFNAILNKEKPINGARKRHFVISVVGDDESGTSNSRAFAVLIILAGVVVSEIKLSWKDCGISHWIANFAEGWILTPPTSEASFEATNRRHANNGVPWVLDPPKNKYISPVRKQSSMELDLESKYIHLAKVASWTHRSWFTYDFHQMALILANCIFDFVGGRTFPFLYKEEGGCGGMPPYQNLETGFSHLVRFNRGNSSRAILGVMDESVKIHRRQMSPNEGLFVKASHFAQMGDRRWTSFVHGYTSLLKTNQLSRADVRDIMRGDITSNLPQDIIDLGIEIESTDPVMGAAISHLRKDGFILTELDVKMILENRRRQEAIGGDVPLRVVLEEIEEETRNFKANHWKVLNLLSRRTEFKEFCTTVPSDIFEDATNRDSPLWNILGEYYNLRSATHDIFTSFQYSDTIRIFKRSDVEHLVRKTPSLLREDLAQGIDLPGIIRRFSGEIPQERKRHKEVLEWLGSGELSELLMRPLPAGIGPDDGRMYNSIMSRINCPTNIDQHTLIIVLISSDVQLTSRIFSYVKDTVRDKVLVSCNISAKAYVRLCLGMIRDEEERLNTTNGRRQRWNPSVLKIFNFITKEETSVPRAMQRQFEDLAPGRNSKVLIEYDYPNIERYLERTRYEPSTKTIVEVNGGFLDKRTLDTLPSSYSWAAIPVSKLTGWTDFQKSVTKRFPLAKLWDGSINVYRPIKDSLLGIDNWRHSVASLSGS